MDTTEDLSARVLLRHILSTEPPRTPITRSVSKAQSTRRSRLSNRDAGTPAPQDILRHSIKRKMRESITRKSLPATTRSNTNTAVSLLFDEGDTPRNILRNILQTDPVKSPVVHEEAVSEEPQLPSSSSSFSRKRSGTELSGLDLPDLTIGNAASTAKGLRRKRPRRSLNVTDFEKRLKDGGDVEVEIGNEQSRGDHSSFSLSSSTSLSLKTPFVDVQTEKRGLQRRITNRRKITEDEFGAAVNRRQMEGLSSFAPVQQGLSETADSEGFTMGLSKLSKHDITTDIVNCNTALYAQSDAVASNFSIVATQDKPTVMASQLQRQIREMEQEEKINFWKEKSTYAFPTEEWAGSEPQTEESCVQLDEGTEAGQSQKDNRNSAASGQYEDTANMSKSVEGLAESQTSVRHDTLECEEEENRVKAQKEEEPQSAEDAVTMSQSEEDKVAEDTQTKEDDDIVDSGTEQDDRVRVESEEDVAPFSQSNSEEGEVEPDSQTQDGGAVDCQDDVEARSQSAEDDNMVESKTEDEHEGKQQEEEEDQHGSRQLKHDLEHISQRAHRSEGRLIMPVTEAGRELADAREAGWGDGNSKAHSTIDLHSGLETENRDSSQLHTGIPDVDESSNEEQKGDSYTLAKPVAGKENSVNPQEVMHDIENSSHLSDSSLDEAAAQDAAEQEDVREDEEDDEESIEDFPCKTPSFVREKMNFFHTHPQASASVLKNIQASATNEALPAAKSKQESQRKRQPAEKKTGLPKSYLMAVFKHFAKTKVSADVYPILKETMDKFFDRLAEDLETYAHHAKRNTIEFEDTVLLLKRQGYVNDKVPVEVLIEKYLRMDQRRLLIPIATSGNVVIPKKRR